MKRFFEKKGPNDKKEKKIVFVPFDRVGIMQSFVVDGVVFSRIEEFTLPPGNVKMNAVRLSKRGNEEFKSRFHRFNPEDSVYDINVYSLAHESRINK